MSCMIEWTKEHFRMERFDIEEEKNPCHSERNIEYQTLDRVDEREIESTNLRKFIEEHGDKVTVSATVSYTPRAIWISEWHVRETTGSWPNRGQSYTYYALIIKPASFSMKYSLASSGLQRGRTLESTLRRIWSFDRSSELTQADDSPKELSFWFYLQWWTCYICMNFFFGTILSYLTNLSFWKFPIEITDTEFWHSAPYSLCIAYVYIFMYFSPRSIHIL